MTTLEAIGTAVPAHSRTQAEAAAFMQRITSLPENIRQRIPFLYERSAIGRRYSCVADYAQEDPAAFTLFPPDWSFQPAPSTAKRNAVYQREIVPLAERAAREALERAGRDVGEVTHLVFASCTGFFAPGPDIHLVRALGLPMSTKRTLVGFMGCYAAFNAMRVASAFTESDPNAVVLVVCAELCTLHFQISDQLEDAVVNALFADGAAAAVVSGKEKAGTLAYLGSHVTMDANSLDYMTWAVGDTGYDMGLSSRVPSVIARHLDGFVAELLAPVGKTRDDVDFWPIHPGGRAIVDKAVEVLNLPEGAVQHSLDVLHDYGNMSSATILFVLERFLRDHQLAIAQGGAGLDLGVAMAFGPGLTLEGAVLRGQ